MRVMSLSSKVMLPELAGVTPQMVLTSVVLPAPLGPIRPSTSPFRTLSETSRSACRPLKCRNTFCRRRISDMFRPPPKHACSKRDQAVRQKQQQHNDDQAEHAGMDLDIIAPDHLFQPEIEERAA